MRTAHRQDSLTISLYASLLSLGVSLMVPINTKNKPRAKDRATIVTVLGEVMFRYRARSQALPTEVNASRTVSRWRCIRGMGFRMNHRKMATCCRPSFLRRIHDSSTASLFHYGSIDLQQAVVTYIQQQTVSKLLRSQDSWGPKKLERSHVTLLW